MLRVLRKEARQAGHSRLCSRDRRRLARVKILTVEGFHDSVQSNSVPFRPSSTLLRLAYMLEATAWSSPFSDSRLELCKGKDHLRSSFNCLKSNNNVTSQASEVLTAPTIDNTSCSSEMFTPYAEYTARPFRTTVLSRRDNMAARSLPTACVPLVARHHHHAFIIRCWLLS